MQEQRGNWTYTRMMAKAPATAQTVVAAAVLPNALREIVIVSLVTPSGEVTRECLKNKVSAFSGQG
jgi:hypothetical protein